MHRGYIKVFRCIDEWEWHDDLQLVGFFVHLILSANYKESRYHGYTIPRGSLVFGRKEAAKKFSVSERFIRTMLTKLKTTSEVTIKTTNRFSIICIVNYEKFQGETASQTASQASHKRPATDQQLTTSKEGKKVISKEVKQGATLPNVDFLKSLQSNPAYQGIDIDKEMGKCQAWCIVNSKVLTARRFVNWLNRAEKPISAPKATPQKTVPTEDQMKQWKAEAAPMPPECREQLNRMGIRSKV